MRPKKIASIMLGYVGVLYDCCTTFVFFFYKYISISHVVRRNSEAFHVCFEQGSLNYPFGGIKLDGNVWYFWVVCP